MYQIAAYDGQTGERIDVFGALWWEDSESIDSDDIDHAYNEMMAFNSAVQTCESVQMRVERIEVIDHPYARLES